MKKADRELIRMAEEFATQAHAGQFRKYTFEPYIVHPKEVAEQVAKIKGRTPAMIAAAWLHDVVEDTPISIEDIKKHFGKEVADLVYWLTDTEGGGNRAQRKAVTRHRLSMAPAAAQKIKKEDIIANARSIAEHDRHFWKTFMVEVIECVNVMDHILNAEKNEFFFFIKELDLAYEK